MRLCEEIFCIVLRHGTELQVKVVKNVCTDIASKSECINSNKNAYRAEAVNHINESRKLIPK